MPLTINELEVSQYVLTRAPNQNIAPLYFIINNATCSITQDVRRGRSRSPINETLVTTNINWLLRSANICCLKYCATGIDKKKKKKKKSLK